MTALNFPIYSIHFWKTSLKWKENLPDSLFNLITCMLCTTIIQQHAKTVSLQCISHRRLTSCLIPCNSSPLGFFCYISAQKNISKQNKYRIWCNKVTLTANKIAQLCEVRGWIILHLNRDPRFIKNKIFPVRWYAVPRSPLKRVLAT